MVDPDRRLLGVAAQELSLPDLFRLNGRTHTQRCELRAILALVTAILPVVPGFCARRSRPAGRWPTRTMLDTLYTYAWFVTFALSFGLYPDCREATIGPAAPNREPANPRPTAYGATC